MIYIVQSLVHGNNKPHRIFVGSLTFYGLITKTLSKFGFFSIVIIWLILAFFLRMVFGIEHVQQSSNPGPCQLVLFSGQRCSDSFCAGFLTLFLSRNSVMKYHAIYCSYQTLLRLLRSILKQIDLVLFFIPLYGSLAKCLHHSNSEASKRYKTGKQNGFVGACSWFQFWGTS